MAKTNRTPTDGESRVGRLNGPPLEGVQEPGGFDPALRPGPDDITVVTAADLAAVSSPPGTAAPMADPNPPAPDAPPVRSESSPTAGSGGGSGRSLTLSGAPGSRLADVSSLASTLTLLGIPVELQDEFTWYQIAKHAIDSAIEEIIRTRRPSDAALLVAAYDAVGHVVVARGLLGDGS